MRIAEGGRPTFIGTGAFANRWDNSRPECPGRDSAPSRAASQFGEESFGWVLSDP